MGMGKDRRTSGGPNKQAGETGENMGGNLNIPFDEKRQQEYCAELAKTGRRMAACLKVGVHRVTVASHLKKSPHFKEMYEEAMEEYRNVLQDAAHQRGVEGWEEPVYHQGRRVIDTDNDGKEVRVSVRKFDTQLLIMLLKRHCPEFNEKRVVENMNTNVDLGLADIEGLTDEQADLLQKMLDSQEQKDDGEVQES